MHPLQVGVTKYPIRFKIITDCSVSTNVTADKNQWVQAGSVLPESIDLHAAGNSINKSDWHNLKPNQQHKET